MVQVPDREFDFLPLSIRLVTLGGVATPLVLRGTPLPARRSDTFSTAADKQAVVAVELLLGESPLARNCIRVGELKLEGIPPTDRGQPQVKVEFDVSATCAVTARASIGGSQLAAEKTFQPPEELSDGFIAQVLADADSSRAADEAELARLEATNSAKHLIAQAEGQLKQGPNSKLSAAIADLGLALASGDSSAIREKSGELRSSLVTLDFGSIDFGALFGKSRAPVRGTPNRAKPANLAAPPEQKLAPQAHQQVLGKIFGGASFTLDTQLCFVLMPFDARFQPLYDDHIKPSVGRAGLHCERADEIRGPNLITWDIWERINRARLLVAELTDQNPNVFYELGLAHALSKDVILITQSMNFVPFDLKTIRCICYDFTPRGTQKLEKELVETISALIKSA
jgi:hypothetical protein